MSRIKFDELGIALRPGDHDVIIDGKTGCLELSRHIIEEINRHGGMDCLLTINTGDDSQDPVFEIIGIDTGQIDTGETCS